MFVEKLNAQEKKLLVQLLTFIARSDGKIAQQEWHFLNRFCDDNGLAYDINEECELSHICDGIQSQAAKVVTLQHVVQMALADGDYEDIEKQNTVEIAKLLGFDVIQFKRIEVWAIQGYEWVQKGEAMIGDEV